MHTTANNHDRAPAHNSPHCSLQPSLRCPTRPTSSLTTLLVTPHPRLGPARRGQALGGAPAAAAHHRHRHADLVHGRHHATHAQHAAHDGRHGHGRERTGQAQTARHGRWSGGEVEDRRVVVLDITNDQESSHVPVWIPQVNSDFLLPFIYLNEAQFSIWNAPCRLSFKKYLYATLHACYLIP